MTSFRFIHAADLHLDTPFIGLGRANQALSTRLRDASLGALDRIVAKAIAIEASFVVLAGDIYDGAERGVRAQLRFRDAVGRLSELGIQTFIVHGNHDPEGGRWTAITQWPAGVHVMSTRSPESITVTRDGATLATIHGISYAQRHTTDNLARLFPVVEKGTNIAILHCNLGEQAGHAPYSPCSLDDLRSRGMTYWALGHVHRHAIIERSPWVVYPGNTQGRSFAPGERGPKGAVAVEVTRGVVSTCEFFATDSARFFEIHEAVDADMDLNGAVDRLRDAGEALRLANPEVEILIRARLSGRSESYRSLNDDATREEVRVSLNDRSERGVHWLELHSDCRPPIDLESIRAGTDLRAEVLAMAREWAEGMPEDLKKDLKKDLKTTVSPSVATVQALMEAATMDVVERLSAGDR